MKKYFTHLDLQLILVKSDISGISKNFNNGNGNCGDGNSITVRTIFCVYAHDNRSVNHYLEILFLHEIQSLELIIIGERKDLTNFIITNYKKTVFSIQCRLESSSSNPANLEYLPYIA